jgi:hypothetical protein
VKVIIPIEINVKCRSNCAKCKWGQKPSTCSPWDDWNFDNRNRIGYDIMNAADKYFGVENKVVDD